MAGRWWLPGVAAAVLLGVALRGACLGAEFWLDEILSWQLAGRAGSLPGIFTVKHDNNHHLNTAWLVLSGRDAPVVVYRLHVLASGLAAVVVAALIARRWGTADAVFAAFLLAGSSWLVLASAEARGYALTVLLGLLAFAALGRYLEPPPRPWPALVAFWLACILGFLSHLTFVHAYLGLVVWSLRRFARQRQGAGDELRNLLLCHAGVVVFFVPFYLLCIRGMEVAGAPPAPLLPVVGRLIVLGLGGPQEMWLWPLWLAVFAVLLVAGLRRLHAEGEDVWVFFAVTVLASPALFLLTRPPFVFERYFLVSFTFFLLLSAHVLGTLWRHGLAGRLLASVFLIFFLGGNGLQVGSFVHSGRGEFRAALAFVREHDAPGVVKVAGDHDFRVRTYVEFFASRSGAGDVRYLDEDDLAEQEADWLLVHREPRDHRLPPAEQEHDGGGRVYQLVESYPSRGPAAWGWFVYRRIGAAQRPIR